MCVFEFLNSLLKSIEVTITDSVSKKIDFIDRFLSRDISQSQYSKDDPFFIFNVCFVRKRENRRGRKKTH